MSGGSQAAADTLPCRGYIREQAEKGVMHLEPSSPNR